jgi:hypothetical protein
MDRQAMGIHHRVNLAGQAPSRATHILLIVVRMIWQDSVSKS